VLRLDLGVPSLNRAWKIFCVLPRKNAIDRISVARAPTTARPAPPCPDAAAAGSLMISTSVGLIASTNRISC
jgi:hypothetical protein